MNINKIIQGDAHEVLMTLPDASVDCLVTSPPYWGLRDYGVTGQLGLEMSPEEYVSKLCDVFDEVHRVLKSNGTCWVNLGDTYGGTKAENTEVNKNKRVVGKTFTKRGGVSKSLCQIPSRFAIEMTNRGWILRNEIIWHKPNCMPQSVKDRFTVDFEKVFFFVKSEKYYFETQYEPHVAGVNRGGGKKMAEQGSKWGGQGLNDWKVNPKGRNMRSVWKVATKPFKEAHFATFPEALIDTPIRAGCPSGGVVLDPFMGAGTTGLVARKQGKSYIGIELNPEYIEIANKRLL